MLVSASALALWLTAGPAPTFSHQGRPVHPACVTALTVGERRERPLALASCGASREPVLHEGPRVHWASTGGETAGYSVLGRPGGEWLVQWEWSGGGSGQFSGLSLLHLEQGTLRLVKTLAAGDRCNGGLTEATLTPEGLRYASWASPSDVLASVAAGGNAESTVEGSASSCFATLHFLDGALAGLELEDPGPDRPGWTDRFRHQACWNAVQRDFRARGRGKLDVGGAQEFVRAFAQRCLTPDAG